MCTTELGDVRRVVYSLHIMICSNKNVQALFVLLQMTPHFAYEGEEVVQYLEWYEQ